MRVVLDAEALNALLVSGHRGRRTVHRHLEVARRMDREVCVPSVTLAELYRGVARSRALDALLARTDDVMTRDTDPRFARLVGAVLHEAGAGSVLLADAHAVAAAVDAGGGVVLTGDPNDVGRLAAGHPRVVVAAL